jgi:hypothetical protein
MNVINSTEKIELDIARVRIALEGAREKNLAEEEIAALYREGWRLEEQRVAMKTLIETAIEAKETALADAAHRWAELGRELARLRGGRSAQNDAVAMEKRRVRLEDIYHLSEKVADEWLSLVESQNNLHEQLQSIEEAQRQNGLLDLLASEYPKPVTSPVDATNKQNVFRRKGDVWEIQFNGEKSFDLNHSRGMGYISVLLRNPGKEFQARQLYIELAGIPQSPASHYGQMSEEERNQEGLYSDTKTRRVTLDERALKEYRDALIDLDAELAEAEGNGDDASILRISKDKDVLVQGINSALDGRKRYHDEQREKVRVAVTNAVRRAISNIESGSESLCLHLRNSIAMGNYVSYTPERAQYWED